MYFKKRAVGDGQEITKLFLYFLGSLVSLPVELTEGNLSKESSLSSVGCKPSQKSLPLITVEEKAASSSTFLVHQVSWLFPPKDVATLVENTFKLLSV